jgi:asparagine synthase (glutamine-hydrolysing)
MHESFYKSNFTEFPHLGLSLCNVTLNHQESSDTGFFSEDRATFCTFNGELFSTNWIIASLRNKGITIINDHDPAELVCRMYKAKGKNIFEDLNGWFQIVLVDLNRKSVIIANDRLGMHKIFYYRGSSDEIFFAPEIKCFRCIPNGKTPINSTAVVHFLKYGTPLNNLTFFNDVHRVPIATRFIISSSGECKQEEYWTPESIGNKLKLSEKQLLEAVSDRFEKIVPAYFKPGLTGLSLTGGWDTRAILSVLTKKDLPIPCYTFAGMFRDSFDVVLASNLAQQSRNAHYKITLGNEFLRNFDTWVNKAISASDALSRIVRSHEYYMNMQCREYGKIRLTGKYGSQIIRNVTLLKDRSPNLQIFASDFKKFFLSFPEGIRPWSKSEALRFEFPQLESCAQSQEMATVTIRTPYTDNEIVELLLQAPTMGDTSFLQKQIVGRNAPNWAHLPTNRGDAVKPSGVNEIMKKWYTTANFIDTVYNWERLSQKQYRLCQLLKATGASRIFNGRKEWTHYRLWFANELKDYVRQILLDEKTLQRPYWNRRFLEFIVGHHCSQKGNYAWEIDLIMSFELWLRQIESITIVRYS